MPTRTFRLALSAWMILVFASVAVARESGRDCTGYESLKDSPKLEVGKVVGDDRRVNFIKNETDDASCPAMTSACRRKGFLVPGNGVIVTSRTGDFVCVTYVNPKGIETNGWLPKRALVVEPAAANPSTEDWVGTWVREEAKVRIKADSNGSLAIKGDATFGAQDPQRVKRGAVNVGEISGLVTPRGDRLSFAMGDSKTLPVDKGDDTICKVWMRRVGAFLLVDDNNACGGMNVSFRGTYARR